MGDYLVVGLNSDDSVRRLKGCKALSRSRSARLLALSCVDAVVLFSEDTPEEVIFGLKPISSSKEEITKKKKLWRRLCLLAWKR